MIIKGGPRGKGAQLADHLMRTDTNETVKVVGARGVYSKTVKGALAEMEGVAAGSKVTKPLYHVSINPEADERLTLEQWERAADRLEKALGLDGHQRVLVQHLKQGKDGTAREHMHVVWCGVDVATMKAAHHSHNYRTHEEVARDLEREFGLKRTQGVHAELDGAEKPKQRRDRTKDSMQEAVTGWKKADARAAIAAAWNAGKTGGSFKAYLEEAGYQLALGDKRDFVVIDPAGGVHSIRSGVNPTRRGEKGLTVAEIRARFGDLDPKTLPSVAEAKEIAKANYPAFKAARQAEEVKRVFPAKPARPAQPTPTPPTWTREPVVAAPKVKPQPVAQAPIDKTATPQSGPSPAMLDLRARQDELWRKSRVQIEHGHYIARHQLETHHAGRLAACTTDIDQRLNELNSLTSRAGALFDRAPYEREIAYLVAKRQRSLADETARQEKVKDDLRRDHARELEDARGKHDARAALQQKVLEDAEKRRAEKQEAERQRAAQRPAPKPEDRDYDR